MDLALNNLQRLICHKPNKPTYQPIIKISGSQSKPTVTPNKNKP